MACEGILERLQEKTWDGIYSEDKMYLSSNCTCWQTLREEKETLKGTFLDVHKGEISEEQATQNVLTTLLDLQEARKLINV